MAPDRPDLRWASKVRASAAFCLVGIMAGTGLYFSNLAYVRALNEVPARTRGQAPSGHPGEQEQRGHGPAAALGLQADHPDPCDLYRAGGWHHRGRLPDLPEPEGPVRGVHGQGLVAELRPVQAELRRLRLQCHVRRGRLEPPVPAPKKYTVDQMTTGTVRATRPRAGCSAITPGAWSTWCGPGKPGNMLGYVYGPVHGDVWNWWVPVHHNIGLRTGAQPGWELSNDSLYATQQVGAAVLGGRIWVAGGLTDPQHATTKTEFYDPTIGTWSPGPALPVPLHHAMMVSYQNTVWVIGGFEPQGSEIIGVASARVLHLNQAGDAGSTPRRYIMRVAPARRRWRETRSSWSAGGPPARPRRRSSPPRFSTGPAGTTPPASRFRGITWRPRRTARTCTPSAGAGSRSPPIPRRCSASTRTLTGGSSCGRAGQGQRRRRGDRQRPADRRRRRKHRHRVQHRLGL